MSAKLTTSVIQRYPKIKWKFVSFYFIKFISQGQDQCRVEDKVGRLAPVLVVFNSSRGKGYFYFGTFGLTPIINLQLYISKTILILIYSSIH